MSLFREASGLVRIAGSLSKAHITLPVTASTFTGYFVYTTSLTPELPLLLLGVFLLAAGSSALNHFQERRIDALMERTKNRPLPGKQVSPGFVILFSAVLLSTGSLLLFLHFSPSVVLLGIFNFIWYNAVYTPLKKITAFAVIPGSITGGVPPLIGWVAAGGHWLHPWIIIIVIFFFVGQIPHFWLLLLRYGKEYEKAGMPSLTGIFTPVQLKRISCYWIAAAATASALLPASGLISNRALIVVWLATIAMLVLSGLYHIKRKEAYGSRVPFMALNIFYLVIMILLSAEAAIKNGI